MPENVEKRHMLLNQENNSWKNEAWIAKKMKREHKGRKLVAADAFAHMMVTLSCSRFSGTINEYHVLYNQLSVLLTAIALEAFKRDYGFLPLKLDELVPRYLPEIPLDTFDDFRPLKYRQQGAAHAVYSIGPDRKDDQGEKPLRIGKSIDDIGHGNPGEDIVLFLQEK